jgi:hypothetical protein
LTQKACPDNLSKSAESVDKKAFCYAFIRVIRD